MPEGRQCTNLSVSLVLWFFAHGIMPLYAPLGGSWLNMAESIQRILQQRALAGQHPGTSAEIITWLEDTAPGWNRQPTPFVWGGRRRVRRHRACQRRHRLAFLHLACAQLLFAKIAVCG